MSLKIILKIIPVVLLLSACSESGSHSESDANIAKTVESAQTQTYDNSIAIKTPSLANSNSPTESLEVK